MSTKNNEGKADNNVMGLQNIMFDQLKRLNDPDADLEKEIKRGQALSSVGTVIINAAKVQIDARRVAFQTTKNGSKQPKQLGNAK